MPSIKCRQCNLINFSTDTFCRRCQNPLTDNVALHGQPPPSNFEQTYQPLQQAYQQSYEQQPYQQSDSFQTPPAQMDFFQPPPPSYYNDQYQPQQFAAPSCIKCGSCDGVEMHDFKKEYIPPVALLTLFLLFLPGLLIIILLKIDHKLTAPFCKICWRKYKYVDLVETASSLIFLVGFIAALIAGIVNESFVVFMVIFAVVCAVLIKGKMYCRKHDLKYKKFNKRQIVVDDPLRGDVVLAG
jgi:hypothetical protein